MILRLHPVPLVLALAAASALPARQSGPARTTVIVHGVTPAQLQEVATTLEAQGARLPHRLPPDLLVGTWPFGLEARAELPPGVRLEVVREARALPAHAPRHALARFLERRSAAPVEAHPHLIHDDVVAPEPGELATLGRARPKHFVEERACDRPGPSSLFLAGAVAIGILMPESSDPAEDTENWANEDPRHTGEDRRDLVVSEIMEGLDELAADHPEAGLSFTYDVHRDVPVPYEPILHSVPDRGGWVSATLSGIGFDGGAGAYVHELRERFDTDWGVIAFVADDLNDADNGFDPTGFPFAYALLGGPYLVMTYDNDGYSIDNMDAVMRHELAHTFHALDEYTSAGNSCANVAGYLGVPNANNNSAGPDPACESDVACFMRGGTTQRACSFTLGQLGIRDTDADGIVDPRDNPPDSRLDGTDPMLLATAAVSLTGLVTGLTGRDEGGNSPGSYSINRVTAAEWSLDGGAWTPATPDDGSYGGRCERVTIALAALSEGWHDVELRGTNDVGIAETSPARLRLYVNTDCPDDAAEPDDASATAKPRPAPSWTGFHCAFDADWSRIFLRRGATLTATLTHDEALSDLSLSLWSEDGVRVAHADGASGVATFTTTALIEATHFVVVTGAGEGESAYRVVLDGPCLDDTSEPNPTVAAATDVTPGVLADRMLCAGDLDHYRLGLQAGETLSASLAFDGALGDIDLELVDPAGVVVASSRGTGDTESATVTPAEEGVYAVRVLGKAPTDGGLHDLTVAATGCIDDAAENDDDAATARPVAAGAIRGRLCEGDEDWVSFSVATTSLVRLGLAHDPAANLELELRDDTGARLVARSARVGEVEDITLERLRPGDYTARVLAAGSGSASYQLTLEVEDPILLFVRKDPQDAILSWNDAGQECYTYRRSTDPSDFGAAVTEVVNPSVEAAEGVTHRDRGVIGDRVFLYCYLISPRDCGPDFFASTKTATPYPIVRPTPGSFPQVEYTMTLINDGDTDAFDVTLRDDVPRDAWGFTVLEIPPGAVDSSQEAPAGAFGRGLILVEGIDVPSGGEALVRVQVNVSPNGSTVDGAPLMDNRARIEVPPTPPWGARVFLTDDPATRAISDDTRVFVGLYARGLEIYAFWHAQVDLDLRVIDPCGNVLSPQDLTSAACGGVTGVVSAASCAAATDPGRAESVRWLGGLVSPGTYRIEVAHVASAGEDPACRDRGLEEATIVVMTPSGVLEPRIVTLAPGEGFVHVMDVTM